MESESLHLVNKGLADEIKTLSARVATNEKLLILCLDMIKNFGHFIPNAVEKFNKEFDRIRGVGADDQALSDKPIDTYLDGNPNHPLDDNPLGENPLGENPLGNNPLGDHPEDLQTDE